MKKELPYLLLCFMLCGIFLIYPINFQQLILLDSVFDINTHDSYSKEELVYEIIETLIFTCSFVYFFRILYTKFNNRLVNYLYLIFNGLFMVWTFFQIIASYNLVNELKELGLNSTHELDFYLYSLMVIFLLSIALEMYTSIRLQRLR